MASGVKRVQDLGFREYGSQDLVQGSGSLDLVQGWECGVAQQVKPFPHLVAAAEVLD